MAETTDPPRPRRRWLRGIGIGLLILLLLLVAFHRPIIFEGTRYFVVRAAKQQNLDLSYEIDGSIFSTLRISKLVGRPTEPGPIQRLEIGTLDLRYSLIDAARQGLPALLELVDVRDVYVEVTPAESPPPEKDKQPQQLKFPAIFPKTLNLANVNFRARAPGGDTVLAGLYFSLLPDQPGVLRVETLDIPGVQRWEHLAGVTTYRDRNLVLTDLRIGPEITLTRFNLDASRLDEQELRIALDGEFFGARTTADVHIADLNATNQLTARVDCAGLEFARVGKAFALDLPVAGELERLAVDFRGEPECPASWTGSIAVALRDLTAEGRNLGNPRLDVTMGNAHATAVFSMPAEQGNRIDGWLAALLPERIADFAATTADARIEINLAALAVLAPEVDGAAYARIDARVESRTLAAVLGLTSDRVAAAGAEARQIRTTVRVKKSLDQPADAPPFAGLTTDLVADLASVAVSGYATDAIHVTARTRDDAVTLESLRVAKAINTLRVQADYRLPADLQSWTSTPVAAEFAVDAPELRAFLAPDSDRSLAGTLRTHGQVTGRAGVFNGEILLEGRALEAAGLTVRTLDGHVMIENNEARLAPLKVVLDDRNHLAVNGEARLAAPWTYRADAEVRLADLSRFQALAGATSIAGKLALTWSGSGDANSHEGRAKVALGGARFGEVRGAALDLDAAYTREGRVRIGSLAVKLGNLTLLEGSADLPLDPARVDDPVNVALRTKALDLRALETALGLSPASLAGTLDLDVSASGTLRDLAASVALRARRLQATAADQIAPADVTLDLTLRNDRLSVAGEVRQRLIQPLTIRGNLPLDVERLLTERALDPATPVDLAVRLPRSSLAFVSSLVPAVRQSRGTAAAEVRVAGTIGAPDLSGSVAVDLDALRMTDPSLPPINAFALRLGFARDRVTIDQCRGGLAGGTFAVSGGVNLTRLDAPELDVRLVTRNALVLQNDDLTARVNTDVRVAGPLARASVTGGVFVTRSRFFKDIDILPIGLPGRPAPQPPPEPPAPVSFPDPPLRDWTFDVTIRTADAFLVDSNLANGRITMDLRLGGTGLEPWLDGSVRIEQLSASLPFSRLNIESGLIYFTRDAPFVPKLDLRGTSTIRDYNVTATIYGTAYAPQAIFTSTPPLPQAEVVALIATGTTTEELGRDPNALAGRAALLAAQKLYRTIFKPKPGARGRDRQDTFLSRVQVDAGAIDPKTGRQSLSARVPLTEQFALVGGVDVGGNFRGQLKYLIRFR